jgi:hypothetical protein
MERPRYVKMKWDAVRVHMKTKPPLMTILLRSTMRTDETIDETIHKRVI